ncbi:hypothetical protein CELL2_08505 [Thermotoga sp. Cell2]|uniref:hypothetical protein n=1 Tax=Thermotoga sp. Cell2 TaxID=1157947 RepID=UPI000540D3C8|nr:hypothetical protein [Thermotoga sp. Cell2]AIY88936.1 hypothetical protein CELL2_08505 [Thermotoga sp. Cell2]
MHFSFGYSLVETLALMFCICTVVMIGLLSLSLAMKTRARLVYDIDLLTDEFYAVDFMKHEYEVKAAASPSVSVTSNSLSFNASYDKKSGTISYLVMFKDGLYKIVRFGLSGEGNNYLIETKRKFTFHRKERYSP